MTREELLQLREATRARAATLRQEQAERRERRQARRDAGGKLSTTVRRAIHAHLTEHGPATDDAILEHYEQAIAAGKARPASEDFIRRQRHALLAAGLIAATGETATTRAGRQANTWQAIDPADVPRLAYLDAWARGIGHTQDGAVVLVIGCPYCHRRHHIYWDPAAPEVTDVECGRGPIRLRLTKTVAAKLEAEP